MNPQELQRYIGLYNSNPYFFQDDFVDEIEKSAKDFDLPFKRNMDAEEQKQDNLANQFVSGFSEGFTTLGWAEDPTSSAGQIAHSMGHLLGFAPALAGGILGLGVKGLGMLGVKAVAQTGVKRLGAQGIASSLQTGSKFLAQTKSIPFLLAEGANKKFLYPGLSKAGINVAEYVAKGSKTADILTSAGTLGMASAVGSVWDGKEEMATSLVHGAIMGGTFGAIGNFVNLGKMASHANPKVAQMGEKQIWNQIVRGGLGAGFQGGWAALQGAPTPVLLYETILGGFFGATHKSASEKAGMDYFKSFYGKEEEPHDFYGLDHRGKSFEMLDQKAFQELNPESQAWVKNKFYESSGGIYDAVAGEGQLELFVEKAKESGEPLSEASVLFYQFRRNQMRDNYELEVEKLKEKLNKKELTQDEYSEAKANAVKQHRTFDKELEEGSVAQEVADLILKKDGKVKSSIEKELDALQEKIEKTTNLEEQAPLVEKENELLEKIKAKEKSEPFEKSKEIYKNLTAEEKENYLKTKDPSEIINRVRGLDKYDMDMKEELDLINLDRPLESQLEVDVPNRIKLLVSEVEKNLKTKGYEQDLQVDILKNIVDVFQKSEKSRGAYEDFLVELKKSYPEYVPSARIEREMISVFNQMKQNNYVPYIQYNTVDGSNNYVKKYNAEGKRVEHSRPQTPDESNFKIKVFEFKDVADGNKVLKPYDQVYDKIIKGMRPVMKESDWWSLERDLEKRGLYLKMPKKDTGAERIYPIHKNVRLSNWNKSKENMRDLIRLITGDKNLEIDHIIQRDFKEFIKDHFDGMPTPQNYKKAKNLFRKIVMSNWLYEPSAQFKNAKERVKRETLLASEGMPQFQVEKFLDLTNGTNELEFIHVEGEVANHPKKTNVKGLKPETYKTLTGKEVPYDSEIDGYIVLHTDLFNRILEVNGFDPSTSRLKPTIAAWVDGKLFIVKGGIHESMPEYDKAMGKQNMGIIMTSAGKVIPDNKKVVYGIAEGTKDNAKYRFVDKKGNYLNKPLTTKIRVEDLRIDYGVKEDSHALESQTVKKQFHVLLNELQVSKEAYDSLMNKVFAPNIEGKDPFNKYVTELSKNDNAKRPDKFKIGDIGDAEFVHILNNTKHPLWKELVKHMVNETGVKEREDAFGQQNEFIELNEYISRLQRWAKYSDYDPNIYLFEPEMFQQMALRYRKQKYTYPVWETSSAAWVAGNDPISQLKYGAIEQGTFKLGHSMERMRVINSNGVKSNLGEMWSEYQKAMNIVKRSKNKKESQVALEKANALEEDMSMALMRVPSPAVSGTRILRFNGFIGEKGKQANHGVYMSQKDHFYIDGADVDGDKVFVYQGLPKDFMKQVKKNENELHKNVKGEWRARKNKDEKFNKDFESDYPDMATQEYFESEVSQYLPSALRRVGKSAYQGKQGMGQIVNAKTFLNYLVSDVITHNNGTVKLPVTKRGKVVGNVVLKTNVAHLEKDDGYRVFAVEASSRTADSSNYWNIISPTSMRELLFQKAFTSIEYIDLKGKKRDFKYKDFRDTSYGDMFEINEKMYGKNYETGKKWSIEEVQTALRNASNPNSRMNSLFWMANRMGQNEIKLDHVKGSKQLRDLWKKVNRLINDSDTRLYLGRTKLKITPQYFETDFDALKIERDAFFKRNPDIKEIDWSLHKALAQRNDKSLHPKLQKFYETILSDGIVKPMAPLKEAKMIFNDYMDMYSWIKAIEKGEKLDKAMEDAGNGEFKRDFFAFIQEEATRLKARHRDSLLSTKEGEKRPTNITVDQTEKNIKSLKREISRQAKKYDIDRKVALDYFYDYFLGSIWYRPKSSQQTKNMVQKELEAELAKPEAKRDENYIEYIKDRLDNWSKTYNKTSFHKFPMETNTIPERAKKDFIRGFNETVNMMKDDVPVKDIVDNYGRKIIPEEVSPIEAQGKTQLDRAVELKFEKFSDGKFSDLDTDKISLPNVPKDMPKVLRMLKEDFKALPQEALLNLEKWYALYQNEAYGISKAISKATYSDIRNFQKFIRNLRVQGSDSPRLKKIYYSMFPERVGEQQLTFDMSQMYKVKLPYIDASGKGGFVDVRVPFSTMQYMSTSFNQIYQLENTFTELSQEELQRSYALKDQILGLKNGTIEWDTLHRVAIAEMLNNSGGGKAGSNIAKTERRKLYEEIWKDNKTDYDSIIKKTFKVTEGGRIVEKTGEEIIRWIQNKHGETFKNFYNKWISTKEYFDWRDIDEDHLYKKYDEIVEYLPSGQLNMKRIQKRLIEPMVTGNTKVIRELLENTSLSTELLNRIQYEVILEAQIEAEGYAPHSPQAKKTRQAWRKRFFTNKEGVMTWRSTAFKPIGYVGNQYVGRDTFDYWPQMLHKATRGSRKRVRQFLNEQMETLRSEANKMLTEIDTSHTKTHSNTKIKQRYLKKIAKELKLYKRGALSREKVIDRLLAIQEREFEQFLGTRASGDGGASEAAMEWLMRNHADKEILDKIGFNSRPGSGRSRGETPMPGFSLDYDVVEKYTGQWINSLFKNTLAIASNDAIKKFSKKNPLKDKDKMSDWENYMKNYARDVMGYPTVFDPEQLSLNKEQLKRVKETIKSLEKIPDTEIGIEQIDMLRDAKERVRRNEQLKKIKKTPYYWLSDQVWANFLEKVAKKLGSEEAPKLPSFEDGIIPKLVELPKDKNARQRVLRDLMQKVGAFEAKWSLISLLSHPKTMMGNLLGGNTNTISQAGLRNWIRAKDNAYLYNIFKGSKLADGTEITPDNVSMWSNRFAEESGALESFIVSEASLERGFRGKKMKNFLSDAISEFKKDWSLPDQSLYDVAKKHGVNKAVVDGGAWFMRKSERMLRRDSFFAHYLNSYEVLSQVIPNLRADNPYILKLAVKGVEGTQFLYHSSARPAFSRTAAGKMLTRFMPFAWNSIRFRRLAYQRANKYGFSMDTAPGRRMQRIFTMDMYMFALANIFVSSLFDSALPPPMSYAQDTADWLFGDEKQRERAFFNQWPHPAMAPISVVTGPSMRYALAPLKAIINNDWEPFLDYHVWAMAPFGRLARSVVRTYDVPEMWLENLFGLPIHRLGQLRKKSKKEDEVENVEEL